MAEYHRKIELQSPDDLQYLIANVRRAAHEKIDRDLPPIEGEDKMRRRVEELVQEVCFTPFFVPRSAIYTLSSSPYPPKKIGAGWEKKEKKNKTVPADERL
jgi:kinetochor protein Mis14/NSL1